MVPLKLKIPINTWHTKGTCNTVDFDLFMILGCEGNCLERCDKTRDPWAVLLPQGGGTVGREEGRTEEGGASFITARPSPCQQSSHFLFSVFAICVVLKSWKKKIRLLFFAIFICYHILQKRKGEATVWVVVLLF